MTGSSEDVARILIVDDEAAVAWTLEQALAGSGYDVSTVSSGEKALRSLAQRRADVLISDVRMTGMDGLELLARVRERYTYLPVIVMTAHGTMETAVEAVRRGAFDYLPKPLDLDRVLAVVERAAGETRAAVVANPDTDSPAEEGGMVGVSPAMQEVYRRIAAAADTDVAVLVSGATGTGKELAARALHRHGRRSVRPFVAVNCAALPESLVEAELFGRVAGAYTDAREAAAGRVAAADGGTLFLDEVGELPPATQAKLLRFLEDRTYTPVGGTQPQQADVRVVAASNRDLAAAAESGGFRNDLLYRLQVVRIALPPLSQRVEDVDVLVPHLLQRIARRLDRRLEITCDAMNRLRAHAWPGNVRELKHVIEEAAVLAPGGVIDVAQLRLGGATPATAASGSSFDAALAAHLEREMDEHPGEVHQRLVATVERAAVQAALSRTQGNQLRAGELLGLNRMTVKKIRDL